MTNEPPVVADTPVGTRVSYQVTRADGTVEPPVIGAWIPTTPAPAPPPVSSPRTLVRWIQQKLTKKVNR